MATVVTERQLTQNAAFIRAFQMGIFLPALPILVASGVTASMFPAIGIIPTLGSAATGYIIWEYNKENTKINTAACLLADLIFGFIHFGLLMPIWIDAGYSFRYNSEALMLTTYASCFLIINMAIHFYFAAYTLWGKLNAPHECPTCRARNAEEGQGLMGTSRLCADDSPKYSLLGDDGENTPRSSQETCH